MSALSPTSLVVLLFLAACVRSHAPPPDTSGCFQGVYPSAPSELRRAMFPAPALVTTQLAGVHITVRDSRQPDQPLRYAWVWLGDDEESQWRQVERDGELTVTSLPPGDTRFRMRVFAFEPGTELVRLRAGYIDTLVFRRGYVGNECYIVPTR